MNCIIKGSIEAQALKALEDHATDTVKRLLEERASINATLSNGNSLLMVATNNDDLATVRLLLTNNARITTQNEHGMTALMIAADRGHTSIVKLLLDNENDTAIEARSNTGYTALTYAVTNGHLEIVRLLLAKRASTIGIGNDGIPILVLAANNNYPTIMELLLDHGAPINAKARSSGVTALIMAVACGSFETVRLLLIRGASTTERDEDGKTALEVAIEDDKTDIIALFNEHQLGRPLDLSSSVVLGQYLTQIFKSPEDVSCRATESRSQFIKLIEESNNIEILGNFIARMDRERHMDCERLRSLRNQILNKAAFILKTCMHAYNFEFMPPHRYTFEMRSIMLNTSNIIILNPPEHFTCLDGSYEQLRESLIGKLLEKLTNTVEQDNTTITPEGETKAYKELFLSMLSKVVLEDSENQQKIEKRQLEKRQRELIQLWQQIPFEFSQTMSHLAVSDLDVKGTFEYSKIAIEQMKRDVDTLDDFFAVAIEQQKNARREKIKKSTIEAQKSRRDELTRLQEVTNKISIEQYSSIYKRFKSDYEAQTLFFNTFQVEQANDAQLQRADRVLKLLQSHTTEFKQKAEQDICKIYGETKALEARFSAAFEDFKRAMSKDYYENRQTEIEARDLRIQRESEGRYKRFKEQEEKKKRELETEKTAARNLKMKKDAEELKKLKEQEEKKKKALETKVKQEQAEKKEQQEQTKAVLQSKVDNDTSSKLQVLHAGRSFEATLENSRPQRDLSLTQPLCLDALNYFINKKQIEESIGKLMRTLSQLQVSSQNEIGLYALLYNLAYALESLRILAPRWFPQEIASKIRDYIFHGFGRNVLSLETRADFNHLLIDMALKITSYCTEKLNAVLESQSNETEFKVQMDCALFNQIAALKRNAEGQLFNAPTLGVCQKQVACDKTILERLNNISESTEVIEDAKRFILARLGAVSADIRDFHREAFEKHRQDYVPYIEQGKLIRHIEEPLFTKPSTVMTSDQVLKLEGDGNGLLISMPPLILSQGQTGLASSSLNRQNALQQALSLASTNHKLASLF